MRASTVLNNHIFFGVIMAIFSLFSCGDGQVAKVSHGSIEIPGVKGSITAGEALAILNPVVRKTSDRAVLVLITSGSDINGKGLSGRWEFVFHFPDRLAQAIYSFELIDPEFSDSPLRLRWRLSPRSDAKGHQKGLPHNFIDSPEAANRLSEIGLDWVAGDPDITLATRRLPSGEVVWVTESYGREWTVPFLEEKQLKD